MVRCTRCLLPSTHETIRFDSEGICSICRNYEQKLEIDWTAKQKALDELISNVKGKYDYDCIIPFSGGKDSTFTLLYVVKNLKLKPLVVSFDHGFYRPQLLKNREKVLKKLGVDFLSFTPNWKMVQRLMLKSFLDKGDFCWHCHTGIFSYPLWVAIEKKIPLVFWGEPSSEYTSYYDYSEIENVDETRFNRIVNLGITAQDMAARLNFEFDSRDFKPFTFPPARELHKLSLVSVPLGSFIPWDIKSQVIRIKEELGWMGDSVEGVPPEYDYEKIECYMQGVRDYIKFLKRGYARTTHLTSIDIRNGRKDLNQAIALVEEFERKKPASLSLFLSYIGLSESEFNEVIKSHKIFEADEEIILTIGPKPKDYNSWMKHPKMELEQSRRIYSEWKKDNS
jgi:N-acetyl sugar amidotransferase